MGGCKKVGRGLPHSSREEWWAESAEEQGGVGWAFCDFVLMPDYAMLARHTSHTHGTWHVHHRHLFHKAKLGPPLDGFWHAVDEFGPIVATVYSPYESLKSLAMCNPSKTETPRSPRTGWDRYRAGPGGIVTSVTLETIPPGPALYSVEWIADFENPLLPLDPETISQ